VRVVTRVVWFARVAALATVVMRIARAARPAPPVTAGRETAGGIPRDVTVVVPARDEERRIGPLLEAVVGAPGVYEVVVVDDASTDGTAGLAASLGARVVLAPPLPDGWTGKSWALQTGIESASTSWVVTLDADTRPDPRLPAALVARTITDRLDLLTAAGRFECPTAGVAWLHPAMLTTLVYRYGPVGDPRPRRLLANGQCTALHRERFLAGGGMAPVREHTVEDVALARHVAASGGRVAFLDASSLLGVRMFETFADTWRGWGRSLALPDVEPRWRQCADVATLSAVQALPLVRVLAGRGDVVDLAALLVRAGTLAGTRRAYAGAGVASWLSPLADPLAVAAVARGTLTRRRVWRGRSYPAPTASTAPTAPTGRPARTAGR
jgi:dolichol-phosphate mannosyltransferase